MTDHELFPAILKMITKATPQVQQAVKVIKQGMKETESKENQSFNMNVLNITYF